MYQVYLGGAMKEGKCSICKKEVPALWFFCLSKYDSLKDIIRLGLCDDCAGEIAENVRGAWRKARNVPDEAEEIICPKCGEPNYTLSAKSASPCSACGYIFSIYTGKIKGTPSREKKSEKPSKPEEPPRKSSKK
jgi:ribosomal protein L37E